jgi:hypothetical protein
MTHGQNLSPPAPLPWFVRFLAGFVAMLVLAQVVNEGLGLRFCQPLHNEILHHKVAFFREEVRHPGVVFLGNSQVHYGVMPPLLAAPQPGFNLALPGTGLETSWLLARDLVHGARKPEVLVLGVCPFMVARENSEVQCQFYRYGRVTDLPDYLAADPALPRSVLLSGCFRGVGNLFQYAIAAGRKPSRETKPEYLREGLGSYWLPSHVADAGKIKPAKWDKIEDFIKAAVFTFGDDSRPAAVLRRFRDLARERGVRLVVVYPPQHQALEARLYPEGGEQRFRDWIEPFCRKEGITYLDAATGAAYGDADFEDPFHLNARGAARFSRELAAYLWPGRAVAGGINPHPPTPSP